MTSARQGFYRYPDRSAPMDPAQQQEAPVAAATPAAPDAATANEDAYPTETPLAEMTQAQQLAYWKAQSRKHETNEKARADYDQIKAELEKVRTERMTEAEKAAAAAREEGMSAGRRAAVAELGTTVVHAFIDARIADPAQAAAIKAGINPAAFLGDGAVLKVDELSAFLGAGASAPAAPRRDPHQGPKPAASTAGLSAGAALYEQLSGKTLT